MKREMCVLSAAAALLLSFGAVASPGGNSCASAVQISPGSSHSGDTSTGGTSGYSNVINNLGGPPSPAADAIYYWVSDGQATGSFSFNFSYPGGAAIITGCSEPNASGLVQAEGGTGVVNVAVEDASGNPLVAGTTYYLIVTGIPSGTSADVGAFTFTAPNPLPVELQKISVE